MNLQSAIEFHRAALEPQPIERIGRLSWRPPDALRSALAGFAAGYGTREFISYRRRKAAIRRHYELGLDD
jgi:hypothetical protein